MRAAIAIDLQTFFDEDGNRLVYDADWIMPGERYWRETFVLSPDGDQLVTHPVETGGELRGEIGRLVDCRGELIGETALTARGFISSRDGSIWASSLCRVNGDYRLVLLYSDGSYFVSPEEMEYGLCGVSQSGDYVVLAAWGDNGSDRPEGVQSRVILMNKNGSIIWETELEMIPVGNSAPVISPNDDYCAVVTQASSAEDRLNLLLQVFDMETGQELWRLENPTTNRVTFSSDGNTLYIPGNRSESFALSLLTAEQVWSDRRISTDAFEIGSIQFLKGSNDAEILTAVICPDSSVPEEWFVSLLSNTGTVLAIDEATRSMSVSPNGYLVVSDNFHSSNEGISLPLVIRRIAKGSE